MQMKEKRKKGEKEERREKREQMSKQKGERKRKITTKAQCLSTACVQLSKRSENN